MAFTIGLRRAVAALVLATVAPLGIAAAWSIQRVWRRQLANVDRQNISTVRAISTAVDQEVENTTAALDVIGELHALDAPDTPAFESLATRLIPYQQNWASILLADADGRIVDGVPDRLDGNARAGGVHWARAAARENRAIVSDLFELPGGPEHFVIIAVPVVRQGRVARVLAARVRTHGFSALLRQQQPLPTNGAVALIDGQHRVVARSKEEESYVGTVATQSFIDVSRQTSEGAWHAVSREGTENYAAFSRSARTGLTVGLGLPADEVDAPIRRILWLLVGSWVLVLGAGAGLGLLLGNVIVRALTGASRASMALARGEPVLPPSSRIVEIAALAEGLRSAAATLEERNRERDEASRLKDEFLMTVSHELRTPLTAICGWARMLSTGQIRDAQRPRAIEAIARNATALHQLVNDLLDVSRVVSGKLLLDTQPLVLADVVGAAVDAIRLAVDAKGIQLASSVELAGATVVGDPGRLQQVVWNLLTNAVKFTPTGGRIDIRVGRPDGHPESVEIVVKDSGPGVEAEFLPYAFERFRQGATGTTRAHGGLGLGLAIVRHLVELHGGTVRAENNTVEPGATFRVLLPVRPAAASLIELPRPALTHVRLDDLEVLVVDDDPQARELLSAILENAGADVRAAASADDALVILETWLPDAMLSDIEMPGADGYALMGKVRARRGSASKLVAIAVSAHARPDDRARALNAGFHWHLAKPIEPGELVSVVATLVSQSVSVH
jgi:signal transduction histidine kinase/ActR/RegA family two-component response regulator